MFSTECGLALCWKASQKGRRLKTVTVDGEELERRVHFRRKGLMVELEREADVASTQPARLIPFIYSLGVCSGLCIALISLAETNEEDGMGLA